MSEKRENEIVFEQPLLVMRVIHTENDTYDIEVAGYNIESIGTEIEDEFEAKTVVGGLLKAYEFGLKELQQRVLKSLSKISDENRLEGDRT